MARSLSELWPEIRANERVLTWSEFLERGEKFKGGDLLSERQSAYGCGSCQMLFVAVIDGYGREDPVTWHAYAKPELEAIPYDYANLYDANNYLIKVNNFSTTRNYGDKLTESIAREIFPSVPESLPYGR